MISPAIRNGIIIVVTLVWAANFAAGLVVEGYEPDQAINAVFMAVVGSLFALDRRDSKSEKSDGSGSGDAGGEP